MEAGRSNSQPFLKDLLPGKPCGPTERSLSLGELRPNDLASPRTRVDTDHTLEEVGQAQAV
jgi:hypothetical protein